MADERVSHRVGKIIQLAQEGAAVVDFPGNPSGPVLARTTVQAMDERLEAAPVLLVFENDDLSRPIIVGFVRDSLRPTDASDLNRVLEGAESLELKSGKSSITLRRDGRVSIKGKHIVSRSSGPNRIKGSTVNIN